MKHRQPPSKKPLTAPRKLSKSALLRNLPAAALLIFCAAWPVVSMFAVNQSQLHFSQLAVPLLCNLGLAVLLFGLSWLLLRHVYKASLLASALLLIILTFIPLQDNITDVLSAIGLGNPVFHTSRIIILYCIVFAVLLTNVMRRSTKSWQPPVRLVAVFMGASLAYTCYTIAHYHIMNYRIDALPISSPLASAKASTAPAKKPDMYYIILDRYASQETLRTQYGFSNDDFINFLSSKGFQLTDAHSNYPYTVQSVASSLNGQYLPTLSAKDQVSVSSTKLTQRMILANGAASFAKSQGYSYTQLGSWWDPTRSNPGANTSLHSFRGVTLFGHNFSVSDFQSILLRRSILQVNMGATYKLGGVTLFSTRTIPAQSLHAQSALYELAQLRSTVAPSPGPKMVFAHILLPHPPYVFNANGAPAQRGKAMSEKQLYIEQMKYTNDQVTQLINQLTSNPNKQPIIILQADEGPYPKRFDGNTKGFNWNKATSSELQQKTGILNAYYLPGAPSGVIYPTISPVNSFRTVFNTYFGTNLPLLPDNHYIDNMWQPYKFIDLSGKLENTTPNTTK